MPVVAFFFEGFGCLGGVNSSAGRVNHSKQQLQTFFSVEPDKGLSTSVSAALLP